MYVFKLNVYDGAYETLTSIIVSVITIIISSSSLAQYRLVRA